MMEGEFVQFDENAEVKTSQGSCSMVELDEASQVVEQLLDLMLSEATMEREKKKRVPFTAEQKKMLVRAFAEAQFIKGVRLENLKQEVGLSKEQVSRWFMHRRALELRKKNVKVDVQEPSTVMANVSQVATRREDSENKKISEVDAGDETLKKKSKFSLTAEQRAVLVEAFAEDRFIGKEKEAQLAENLGLSQKKVTKWFHNQRSKIRKEAFVRGNVKKEEYSPKKYLFKWSFTVDQREELEKAFAENENTKGEENNIQSTEIKRHDF